jgi:uncharacterized protein with PQ loop repeat
MEILLPNFVLWILFGILILIFITFGAVFSYHWNHYGMNETNKKVARVTYFFISAVILFVIAFFIGMYNF